MASQDPKEQAIQAGLVTPRRTVSVEFDVDEEILNEPAWLERGANLGVYDRLRASAAGREPFVLHEGNEEQVVQLLGDALRLRAKPV